MNPTKIVIADDHVAIVEGLRLMLGRHPDLEVHATALTIEELLGHMSRERFDIAILDLSLGTGRTGEVISRVRTLAPSLPLLIYTMYPEDDFAARLFAAGIAGYVTKDAAPDILIDAIRRIRTGGRYVTPALAELLAFEAQRSSDLPHEQLSEREMQVLVMTAAGKSLKEIGSTLGVSLKTVSTYRTRTLQKLGVNTNADLIRYAIVHRLTSLKLS